MKNAFASRLESLRALKSVRSVDGGEDRVESHRAPYRRLICQRVAELGWRPEE